MILLPFARIRALTSSWTIKTGAMALIVYIFVWATQSADPNDSLTNRPALMITVSICVDFRAVARSVPTLGLRRSMFGSHLMLEAVGELGGVEDRLVA